MYIRIFSYTYFCVSCIIQNSDAQPVCRRGHLGVPQNFHLS
jgi:hypothetical protein